MDHYFVARRRSFWRTPEVWEHSGKCYRVVSEHRWLWLAKLRARRQNRAVCKP